MKHSRHYDKDAKEIYRKVRSAKHRYVFFACPKKKAISMKKEFVEKLNYPVLPYPKEENKNYKLGEYLEPNIIKVEK